MIVLRNCKFRKAGSGPLFPAQPSQNVSFNWVFGGVKASQKQAPKGESNEKKEKQNNQSEPEKQ
jgi:hypothetical protein